MSQDLIKSSQQVSIYSDSTSFENAQRFAKSLVESSIVPEAYQKNMANAMVALEMSYRLNMSPIEVMQNLNVIKGTPSWKSAYVISRINSSGKYKDDLEFDLTGEGDSLACVAYAVDRKSGKTKKSPKITIKMAKDEGWYGRPGSKWKTMPELMIQYRAAAFFAKLNCPEVLGGHPTVEEVADIEISTNAKTDNPLDKLNKKIKSSAVEDAEVVQGDEDDII